MSCCRAQTLGETSGCPRQSNHGEQCFIQIRVYTLRQVHLIIVKMLACVQGQGPRDVESIKDFPTVLRCVNNLFVRDSRLFAALVQRIRRSLPDEGSCACCLCDILPCPEYASPCLCPEMAPFCTVHHHMRGGRFQLHHDVIEKIAHTIFCILLVLPNSRKPTGTCRAI